MPTPVRRRAGRAWARGAGLVTEAAGRQAADRHRGQYHDGACAPRADRSAGYRKNHRQAATGGAARGTGVADQPAAMPASVQWRRDPGQGGEPREKSRESTVAVPRDRRAGARLSPRSGWCWRWVQLARDVRGQWPARDQPAWDPAPSIAPRLDVSRLIRSGQTRARTVDRVLARNSRPRFWPLDDPSKP
jgi:hypothetical protein